MKEEQLDDRSGEFPRFDERFCMSDYRHGWIVGGDVTDPKVGDPRHDGLIHYDLKTGKSTAWTAGPDDRCGEPIFVPRSETAPEGDGWLLSVVYRGEEKRSDLAIFEATDIGSGPIALAHLSSRVPAGFHGNWRPGVL
jgi:carotenoid cleavage dioxygenase